MKDVTTVSEITLSVAVNSHAEGRLLRPTLRSIAIAIAEAQSNGIACELLIVLDNASTSTLYEARGWVDSGRVEAPVRLIEVSHGDAGASRNAGANAARGKFVAFCDGDDLVSRNYLLEGVRALEASAERIIVHPGTVVSFGARSAVWHVPATEDVDHLYLIRDNLWPSSSISHRSTYIDHPYESFRPEDGLGPEDYFWNIETSIARIPHRPVPDTMFFYRVREFGGVNNRHLRSILPGFDLDGLAAAMPAKVHVAPTQSKPSLKSRLERILRGGYRRARPVIRVLLGFLTQGQKERLYGWAVGIYRGKPSKAKRKVVPPAVAARLKEASEVEPAISWTAHGYVDVPVWNPHHDVYADLLVELVTALRSSSRAIVAVPWVGIGGADLVSLNYAKALVASPRFGGEVSMLATYTPTNTIRSLVPQGVNFVQIPQSFRTLSPNRQRRMLAQALLIVKPELVVSVNCFDVTNSLQLYSHQMAASTSIYLTLFAFDRIGAGYPSNPITDDSQRQYLDEIGGVITDNSVTSAIVEEMLALESPAVRVHHQPALDTIPGFRPGTRAFNNRFFSDKNPFSLIWPHRLDREKRPESLIEIARLLRVQNLPVEINVYGQQVLSGNGKALMKSLADAGIKYRGPYSGGLPALPTHDYHALLLTSESEGLPLVLVQSMLLGLPVIATAVGGVTDIVRDNETGILVSGPEDAEGFVAAIKLLMESLEDRQRLIRAAYDFAVAQHGWERFTTHVEALADGLGE